MQGHLFVDDAAGQVALGIGLLMLFDHVDVLDDYSIFVEHTQHGPAHSLVFAGEDEDVVTLSDLAHGLISNYASAECECRANELLSHILNVQILLLLHQAYRLHPGHSPNEQAHVIALHQLNKSYQP